MDRNLIIEASAGSGKTYKLAERYVEILSYLFKRNEELKIDGIGSIVAITFTNKAAAEMKERILRFLKELSGFGENRIKGIDLTEENSLELLIKIISNYSDFNIMTIDSFMNRIMKAFSVDLGISPDYEITFDKDEILNLAFKDLIEDKSIKKDLIEFLKTRLMLGDKGMDGLRIIEKAILSFDPEPFEFANCTYIKENELLDYCNNICGTDLKGDYYSVTKIIEKDLSLCWEELQKLIGREYEKLNKRNSSCLFKDRAEEGCLEKFKALCNGDIEYFLKKNTYMQDSRVKDISNIACKIFYLLRFNRLYSAFKDAKSVSNVYTHFIESKREIEKQLNVVEGSRIAEEILKVLTSKNGVSYAFIQLGEKLYNYLIDEFQDTSKQQFEAIYPLIENAVSSGGSLFVVGDKKQAIYGWRGGDYRIFNELKKRNLPERIKEDVLNSNYRSVYNIVEFNNKIFNPKNMFSHNISSLLEKDLDIFEEEIPDIYKNVEQKAVRKDKGFIKVILKQTENKENFYRDELLETIGELLEKNIDPGKIMILLRRKSDIEKITFWISEKYPDINIITEDSLILTNNPVIKHLLIIASAITLKNNTSYEKAAINITGKIGKEKLYELKDKFKGKSLYEVVAGLLSEIDFDYSNNELYITTLLEEILKQSHMLKTNDEIIENLFNNPIIVSLTEATSSLRIMTIHKAKGLQSHTVIIPFYDWIIYDSRRSFYDFVPLDDLGLSEKCMFSKVSSLKHILPRARDIITSRVGSNFIEALNLMYVANTRAESNLFIIGAYNLKSDGNIPKNITSAHLIKNAIEKAFSVNCKDECIYKNGELLLDEMQEKRSKCTVYIEHSFNNNIRERLKIPPLFEENKNKILTGDLFHTAMSFIGKIEEWNSIYEIVENSYTKATNILRYKNENVKVMIEKAIADLKEFFFDIEECFNEKEFVNKYGKILRPDRIIIKNGRIYIIDYKTGEKSDKHKYQIMEYMSLFKEAKGYIYYCKDREKISIC